MLRVEAERTGRYCDGLSRRSFVQLGLAGVGSLGLADLLRARASAETASTQNNGGLRHSGKDTSVILIWLDGGPSHIDLYDLKPEAPAEYRGIWSPIHTNVPGIDISEMFPLQAKVADKFSLIRSLHHDNGDHFTAGHWMLTGQGGPNGTNTAGKAPFFGSLATKVTGPRQPGMPAYVAVPHAASIGLRPGYFGGHYLGAEHNPFETEGDPNNAAFAVNNLRLPGGLTLDRLQDRRGLVEHFDRLRRDVDARRAFDAVDRFQAQAFELVAGSKAATVFDLSREEDRTRDRYGRTSWGQSTLLARRLVEAGCTLVTVHCGGWDHHWDLQAGMDRYLPDVDRLVSALLADLHERSLLEKVLVLVCGEFGRTPKMNDGGNGGPAGSKGTPGRDHWGNALCCLIAGGGVRGGRIVGSTNSRGEVPKDRPLTPGDLHATVFHVLGVDPHTQNLDHSGRPVTAVPQGEVIRELF